MAAAFFSSSRRLFSFLHIATVGLFSTDNEHIDSTLRDNYLMVIQQQRQQQLQFVLSVFCCMVFVSILMGAQTMHRFG